MKKNSLLVYLSYAPLRLLILFSRILPVKMVFFCGNLLGELGYHFARERRKAANNNLKFVFGKRFSQKGRTQIVKAVFRNLGLSLAELLLIPRLDEDYLKKHAEFENVGRVDEAVKKGKGTILLSAHYGNWELASIICAVYGYKILFLGRPQKPYFLNNLLNQYRQMKGCRVVEKGVQIKTIIHGLKQNHIVGIAADQSGKQGREMDFFGRPVFMAEGAFRIAAKTGSVILPAFNIREGFKHRIVVEEPIMTAGTEKSEQDIQQAMLRYRDLLEKYISLKPQQWLWVNKRWKHSKAKSVLILHDGKTGHLRQAQTAANSIVKQLSRSQINTIEISFKNNFLKNLLNVFVLLFGKFVRNPLPYLGIVLKPDCYKKLEDSYSDVIICCGSLTRACALLMAKENLSRTISIMRPLPFSEDSFSLAIIPEHDLPKPKENVLITTGALNLVDSEYLAQNTARLKKQVNIDDRLKIGLLIGGDSRYYKITGSDVRKILGQVKNFLEENNAQLLVSTSRRTPEAVDEFIHKSLDDYQRCIFKVFPSEKNYEFAVGGILGVCSAVIVSGESISMISEAASSGKFTIVFVPEKKKPAKKAKHDLFLENLSRQQIIRLVQPDEVYNGLEEFKENPAALKRLEDSRKLDETIKAKIIN